MDRFLKIVHALWLALMVVLNLFVAAGLVVSAFVGDVSPLQWKYSVPMMMVFPGWLAAALAVFVFDLVFWKRTALIMGIALIACSGRITEYSPLNIPRLPMSEKQKARSFTLMTYNVYMFLDKQYGEDVEMTNSQLDYILDVEPDVVVLQESQCLAPTKRNHIDQEQIDQLSKTYPYVFTGNDLALFSKFPAEPLPVSFPKGEYKSGDICGWRLHIPDPEDKSVDEVVVDSIDMLGGRIVNLFGVHLRSLALSSDEKNVFESVSTPSREVHRSDLRYLRNVVVPKLMNASYERVGQAHWLEKFLAKYGGETAILCGDFNDVPGCYTLNKLDEVCGMKQVYEEVGFGPMVTYNANNFYFRIDHILYRGKLQPYSIRRGNLKASDHYPLIATFLLK